MNEPEPTPVKVLIDNGECCGNRCWFCPYEPKYSKGAKKLNDNGF